MKTFTAEELLKMIQEKDLKIVLVSEVSQDELPGSYLVANFTEEDLKSDTELYGFNVLSTTYELMSDDEISFINKNGYAKWKNYY